MLCLKLPHIANSRFVCGGTENTQNPRFEAFIRANRGFVKKNVVKYINFCIFVFIFLIFHKICSFCNTYCRISRWIQKMRRYFIRTVIFYYTKLNLRDLFYYFFDIINFIFAFEYIEIDIYLNKILHFLLYFQKK